jgi:hypothetical protein
MSSSLRFVARWDLQSMNLDRQSPRQTTYPEMFNTLSGNPHAEGGLMSFGNETINERTNTLRRI